ncbi:MAG: PPC domain-containing protein [Planctomycetaceae bacterium]|nr:PPC domain-containing protein [Planctomycetaceae bacterium]
MAAIVAGGFAVSLRAAEPPSPTAFFPAGVQRGQSASVKIIGAAGDAPLSVWTNRPEWITAQPGEAGTFTLTAAAETPAGVYWVRLFNEAGASRLRPLIIGSLPELAEVEPNNAAAVSQSVDAAGVVLNGILDQSNDVDMVQVPLTAGQTLVASLDADRTLGSPMDGILQIVSPQGFVVAQNDDDHGIDPQIVFTAPADGVFAVRLFSFPKDPNSTIAFSNGADYVYRLTLTTGPFVDRVAPTTSDPAGPYRLTGWNMPEPVEIVPQKSEAGLAAGVDVPGTWEFDRLPVVPAAVQAETDPEAATNPLAVPGAVWGCLEQPGDRDICRFTAAANVKYTLTVFARRLGSPLDPVLTVRTADGTVLDRIDDVGSEFDSVMTLVPSADGEHEIEIADRYEFGGERYFYVVTAIPEQPGFSLELDQDAFTVKSGEPLEVKLKVLRTGGMAEPVTLSLDGLPAGVTATMISPEPESPGSLVVPAGTDAVALKLEAPAGTKSGGPFSVTGAAGETRRAATAPLIRQPLRSPDIWLTVTP